MKSAWLHRWIQRTTLLSFLAAGLVLTGLFSEVHAQTAGGGRVLSAKKRKEVLEIGQRVVHQEDPALQASLGDLAYPFAFKEAPKPVVEKSAEAEPVVAVVEVVSDQEILLGVAEQIRPTGTLARGNKTVLVFAQGIVPEGGSVRVNFREKPYAIKIVGISERGYTLTLNDAKLERTFGATGEGSARRDSAQP